MKIGEFSKKFNVKRDTIRYYIETGLLLPEKIRNQYIFDESCIKDMKEIIELKNLKFTISGIQKIFSLKRMTNLTDISDIDFYLSFFENKKQELLKEKEKIEKALNIIEEKISYINTSLKNKEKKIGIPLQFINYLVCPKCNKPLELNNATIKKNYIFTGELNCDCGYHAQINKGIIITPEADTSEIPEYEKKGKTLLNMYDQSLLTLMEKGGIWIYKRLFNIGVKNKVIMEIGTGLGRFVKNSMVNMGKDTLYIATEKSLDSLKTLKNSLELAGSNANIVFIAGDYTKCPIKSESIDIVIDYFGTRNYLLKNSFYPVEKVSNFLKKDGIWIGTFTYYENHAKSLKNYAEKTRNLLLFESIKNSFTKNSIKKLESSELGFSLKMGEIEKTHIPGDKLHVWAFLGKKI
ncbi:methyltransferase [Tepiditoga spiralis]|uniref:Methyltransferase n=1 Tax=Tepiditoga spiralis TaxID=2108365 RepID=A0A7G1G7S9_9BACT|nr:MerR family transcriptional regulator [Tepiditoga spiralis]BBE30953.1 methyltransferase [Tepiditoga spiralis]